VTVTLPSLAAGTYETRGQVFVRLAHLVDWLDEVEQIVEQTDADQAALVDELRRTLERFAEAS
jgi:hypothetical protein